MSKEDDEREERRKRLLEMSSDARILSMFEKLIALAEAQEEESSRRTEDAQRKSDEMQRNMDFIVRQQAQFSADLQHLREVQARSEQKWERTAQGITALLALAEMHEREIFELRQTQAEAQARTDAQMVETGERLNALINTVEQIISERRNGGQKGEGNSE
ncbi:MAG: hypothetical protein M3444_02205 [Acidobacteriota bacterium]|nr:hypothetical protein [Acidobacteriota bacterium]MDQ5836841.1 hypothetical protein [Acidobacteriota bacterium]